MYRKSSFQFVARSTTLYSKTFWRFRRGISFCRLRLQFSIKHPNSWTSISSSYQYPILNNSQLPTISVRKVFHKRMWITSSGFIQGSQTWNSTYSFETLFVSFSFSIWFHFHDIFGEIYKLSNELFGNFQRWCIIMLPKKGNSLTACCMHKIHFNRRSKNISNPKRTAFRQIIASNNIIIIFSTLSLSLAISPSASLRRIKIALCFQYKYICGMETRRKSLEISFGWSRGGEGMSL